jgi:hypothetical protein
MHTQTRLLRFRFFWLNLLFVGYLWLLQPAVLQRLFASSQGSRPDWLMGGILLGIQVIEVVGLLLKRPVGCQRQLELPPAAIRNTHGWSCNDRRFFDSLLPPEPSRSAKEAT